MRMTKKELASICSLLIAGAAFGDFTPVAEAFESSAPGDTGGWSNAVTVVTGGYAFGEVPGYPITEAAHTQYLSVDDSVTYTPATAPGGAVLLDMMVQAAVPDDELEFPDGDATGVQIAIGVDKIDGDAENGKLKVWCTPKTNTSVQAWCDLVTVGTDTWHRVTLVFDYAAKYAQVRVDGQPVMTENGYLTTAGGDATGAWYKLATAPNTLTSVSVIGSTGLDDFVLKADESTTAVAALAPVTGETGSISNSWFDAWGIAWNAGASYDDSGLTLAQKFEAGLNPLNGDKLEIKAMVMSADKATFTIPPTAPAPGKAVKLFSATSSSFSDKDQGTAVSGTAVTLDLPGADAPVKYYRLETVNE